MRGQPMASNNYFFVVAISEVEKTKDAILDPPLPQIPTTEKNPCHAPRCDRAFTKTYQLELHSLL